MVHGGPEAGESGRVVHEVCGEDEEEVAHMSGCQVHEFDGVGWPFKVVRPCVLEGLGVWVADLVQDFWVLDGQDDVSSGNLGVPVVLVEFRIGDRVRDQGLGVGQ